jgi:acyl carrier protein
MDRQEILVRVKNTVGRVLHIDPPDFFDGAHFVRDLDMDSMQSLQLIAALEDAFKIKMDETKALSLLTVATTADYIGDMLMRRL